MCPVLLEEPAENPGVTRTLLQPYLWKTPDVFLGLLLSLRGAHPYKLSANFVWGSHPPTVMPSFSAEYLLCPDLSLE